MLFPGYVSTLPLYRERWYQVRRVKTPAAATPDQIQNPTDYVGIWAMYRKVSTYTGPIWKIRRASDGAELDCYTLAEAVSHIGGSTGYVIRWYDQSGNGRFAYESNSTIAPIFNASDTDLAGSMPSMNTHGRGMQFTSAAGLWGNNAIISIGYKPNQGVGGGARVLTGDNNWLIGPYDGQHRLHDSGFVIGPGASNGVEVICTIYRESGSSTRFRVNGTYQGASGGSGPGTNMYLGYYGSFGGEAGKSNVFELLWRNPGTATVAADAIAVETKINQKYSIF